MYVVLEGKVNLVSGGLHNQVNPPESDSPGPVFINRSYSEKQLGPNKNLATERFAKRPLWYSDTVRNILLASSRFSTRFTQRAIYSLVLPDWNPP